MREDDEFANPSKLLHPRPHLVVKACIILLRKKGSYVVRAGISDPRNSHGTKARTRLGNTQKYIPGYVRDSRLWSEMHLPRL